MKKYPKMKPSGVEWIGDVPEEWEVKKLKYVASLKSGESIISDQILEEAPFPVFGGNGLRGYFTNFTHEGHYVLIGRQGALCGNINYANGKFWASEHAVVVSIKDSSDTFWLGELLRAMNLNQYSLASAQPGLAVEKIQNLHIPVPSIPEKAAIAAYLDRKTAQIDQAIAEKERLIELFREERQAIINHAVTKGIRPSVKMKPSGVEWIGDVPEGWEVSSIKRAVSLLTDYDANGSFSTIKENVNRVDEPENQFAWMVRATDLENQSHIYEIENLVWVDEKTYKYLAKSYLSTGDLLVVKRGEIGKLYLMPHFSKPATLGPNMYLVRLKSDALTPKFGYYFLSSEPGNAQLRLLNKSTTLGALYKDDFKSILIAYPPIAEQLEIASYLDHKTAQIDTAISGIRQEIALLQEYRQALIFEAVTGKIDVT